MEDMIYWTMAGLIIVGFAVTLCCAMPPRSRVVRAAPRSTDWCHRLTPMELCILHVDFHGSLPWNGDVDDPDYLEHADKYAHLVPEAVQLGLVDRYDGDKNNPHLVWLSLTSAGRAMRQSALLMRPRDSEETF